MTGLSMVLLKTVPNAGLVLIVALAAMETAIAAFAFAPGFTTAVVIAVALGLGSGTVGSIVYTVLIIDSPPAALGRVMALLSITLEGAFPISTFATGYIVQTHGTDPAFLLGGTMLVLTAAAAATRPAIRQLQMPPKPQQPAPTT